jgi:predicted ATPase
MNSELEREASFRDWCTRHDQRTDRTDTKDMFDDAYSLGRQAALSTEAQNYQGLALYMHQQSNVQAMLGDHHKSAKFRQVAMMLYDTQPPADTEAQPEVTGAVAEIVEVQVDHDDYSLEVKLLQPLPHGTKLYPPSAIEAAVREKLEAVKERDRLGYAVVKLVEAVDALLEAGSDEYLHDENGDFTYEEAPSDYWADLRTAADNMVLRAEDFEEKYRALMESPQPSVEEPAN